MTTPQRGRTFNRDAEASVESCLETVHDENVSLALLKDTIRLSVRLEDCAEVSFTEGSSSAADEIVRKEEFW